VEVEDSLVKERLWLELRRREELQFFLLSPSTADKEKERYRVRLVFLCFATHTLAGTELSEALSTCRVRR
jgi:hypothetical protein